MNDSGDEPVVAEVVAFENLPFGALGSRSAIARWSDGSVSEAIRWRPDELLICEGDLIGKTRAQIHSVHVGRVGPQAV